MLKNLNRIGKTNCIICQHDDEMDVIGASYQKFVTSNKFGNNDDERSIHHLCVCVYVKISQQVKAQHVYICI